MRAEDIMAVTIIAFVAAVMLIIGLVQFTSKKPVTFYTGEMPLDISRYTNVKKWNHAHGILWMSYGLIIIAGCIAAHLIGSDTPLCVIPYFASILVPLPLMILCHKMLQKRYIINP